MSSKNVGIKPPVDADGVEIPEDLRRVFAEGARLETFAREFLQLKRAMKADREKNEVAWSCVDVQKLESGISQIVLILRLGRPHILCPRCGGVASEDCGTCRGRRLLSKHQAMVVDIDARNVNRKANGLGVLPRGRQR